MPILQWFDSNGILRMFNARDDLHLTLAQRERLQEYLQHTLINPTQLCYSIGHTEEEIEFLDDRWPGWWDTDLTRQEVEFLSEVLVAGSAAAAFAFASGYRAVESGAGEASPQTPANSPDDQAMVASEAAASHQPAVLQPTSGINGFGDAISSRNGHDRDTIYRPSLPKTKKLGSVPSPAAIGEHSGPSESGKVFLNRFLCLHIDVSTSASRSTENSGGPRYRLGVRP